MPRDLSSLPNEIVVTLAIQENHVAREEMLRREIMAVDDVDWETASKKILEMKRSVRHILKWGTLPYHFGACAAVIASVASIPLVFGHDSVEAFNDAFVTMETLPENELDTWLEVGAWSWNWMEPPLGTVSFVLLCFQFARNQVRNAGVSLSPYQSLLYSLRRKRLLESHPQYDRGILNNFAETLMITHVDRDDGKDLDDGFSGGPGFGRGRDMTTTASSAI